MGASQAKKNNKYEQVSANNILHLILIFLKPFVKQWLTFLLRF